MSTTFSAKAFSSELAENDAPLRPHPAECLFVQSSATLPIKQAESVGRSLTAERRL
jgi:hypothetical protein